MKNVIKVLKKLEKIKNNNKLMLRGSLYKTQKKCGNKNCKTCNSGKMHDAIHFTYFENGKNRMAYINQEIYQEIKEYWQRYKTYHLLVMELKKEIEMVFKDLNIYTNSHTISIDMLRNSIKKVRKN
jgi:hypothetical protein